MGRLVITPIKQAHENSCWAACIRMVLAHYKGPHHASDDKLAQSLGVTANKCQDIQPLMEKLGIYDATDDTEIKPSFDEIKSEIDKGRPIIQCMNHAQVAPGQSSSGGHYIVINGYDDKDQTLSYIDPSTGLEKSTKYSAIAITMNGVPMYFAQPYYSCPV